MTATNGGKGDDGVVSHALETSSGSISGCPLCNFGCADGRDGEGARAAGIRGGLAKIEKVAGTFIAYATAPESAAIQNTSSLAVLATFQERYPDPPWYDYAEARAQELRAADAARREAEARERAEREAEAKREEMRQRDDEGERQQRERETHAREDQAPKPASASPIAGPIAQTGEGTGGMKRPPNWVWAGLGLIVIALGIGPVTPTWADKVKRPQQPEKSQAKSLEGPKASQPTITASTSCAGVEVSLGTGGTTCIKPGSGKSFKDCAKCPEMVVVPAGRFIMGSPKDEDGRDNNEDPQHQVIIPRPFAVGKFEVTFAEWDACVAAGGCTRKPGDEGWGRDNRPVINVSWRDAQAYVKWLSAKTGKPYRLLSEAEWEYAARAGTTGPFSFDGPITTDKANYNGNYSYGSSPKGEYRQKTVPVDSFAPNPWGLYQVHGNVWEWVEDCYHHSYKDKPDRLKSDGSAWTTGDCTSRVVRGGSWGNGLRVLRSAVRGRSRPVYRISIGGFRLARTWADKVKRPQRPEKSQAKSLEGPKVSQPTITASASCAGVEVSLGSGGTACIKPGSGKSFKDCAKCPEMVVVPAGKFLMGSPKDEEGRDNNEGPQHQVVIPQPFAVGKFEVTNAQFVAFLNSVGRRGPIDQPWFETKAEDSSSQISGRPGNFVVEAGKEQHPLVNVSWYGAQAYAKWLSENTGKPYRLLSEAEWEYVARAGTTTAYPWGDKFDSSKANNGSKTVAVGQYGANRFGLYDMHGNVWEKVEDCYHDSYKDKPDRLKATGEAWTSEVCTSRVARGGSWGNSPRHLRSAVRSRGSRADYHYVNSGFRLARTRADKVKRPQQPGKSQAKSLEGPKASQPTITASASCVGVKVSGGMACIKPGSGKSFKDCTKCPKMVVVPAGRFMMGSPEEEEERHSNQGPQHEVVIPKAFAVGKYAVTRGQFAAFVRASGHKTDGGCRVRTGIGWNVNTFKSWRDPRFSQGDNHPVTCVNWEDAQAYAKWLSAKTGKPYRLLSEAEWEYAARAGTTGPFSFDGPITTDKANYDGNYTYAGSPKGEYRRKTVPVDRFAPNPWGLYQVHGNVWEWVEDCYHNSYAAKPDRLKVTGEAWTSRDCTSRVGRGGSWFNKPRMLRSAHRGWNRPGNRSGNGGFRLARTITP